MKKTYIAGLMCSLFISWIVLSSSSGGRASSANTGNTGAPGETSTCSSCHSGGSYGTVTLTIQAFDLGTTNAVTAYTPATQYDMRVTINHTAGTPAGHGFQLTAMKTGNTPIAGYANLGTNVKQKVITSGQYNGRTYLEHNGVSTSNQFNFRWTSPATGSGTVTFYSAGNCVNNTGSDNGDKAGNSSLALTETVVTTPLSVSGVTTNIKCFAASTGAINITGAGGTAPYTYSWTGGSTTEDQTNLAAGNYSVTIKDATNATATASFTITQPAAAVVASSTAGNIQCNGGTATVTVTAAGGTPPYTGTGTFTVGAGPHNYTVTDANGCTAQTSVTLSQPAALQATGSSTVVPCAGSGTVTVQASGGTAPYTGTGNFSVSAAGNYNYTVTDANGCTANASVTVVSASGLSHTSIQADASCNGSCDGYVYVTVNGGAAPYTYAWTGTTGADSVEQLCAGTYSTTITDANSCSIVANYVITQPTVLAASAQVVDASSNNGSINLSVSGATPPYNYVWTNSDTTQDINQLSAGIYSVTITDKNGCTASLTDTVDVINAITAIDAKLFMVYPNPATDLLHISLSTANEVSITILNLSGSVLYKETLAANTTTTNIDVAAFPSAMYFIKITSAQGSWVKQFLKQ